jgi:hypothetical protein
MFIQLAICCFYCSLLVVYLFALVVSSQLATLLQLATDNDNQNTA